MNFKRFFYISFFIQLVINSIAQNTSYNIRINQLGFLPNSQKKAVIVDAQSDSFRIKTVDLKSTVYQGVCLPPVDYASSGEKVRVVDFSLLQTSGDYVLVVDDLGKSLPFSIKDNLLVSLSKASIKAFYYNRASTALSSEHAGIYARAMGHPDDVVVVHPSAASASRPAGTVISTPGGWYDAGDYNKYIVNSGISVFTLLSAYETYSAYFDTLNLNIPESTNQIPDILDEALWNIKWMMTMQDPSDGGVYHKTTEAQFSAFVMPSKVTSTRYVTAKSTAAALDFAAVMAMTARVYKNHLPDLASQAMKQAVDAYNWAKNHPNVQFKNPSASGSYPAIGTGDYADGNLDDEFSWCASELFVSTNEPKYYSEVDLNKTFDVPGWPNVRTLGLISLNLHSELIVNERDRNLIKSKLLELAAGGVSKMMSSPYRIPGENFYWGGNNAYANYGMLAIHAFRLTKNASYFNSALSSLDYLLGRNATSYCFVTGFGTKRPMNIHHRVSGSDGIKEPIPGFLVGGSNPANLNDCGAAQYSSSLPAKAYADLECSYSTNEIAINWNAPLVFLTGAIHCEYQNCFTQSMPDFLALSSRSVSLPAKSGFDQPVVIEGNASWSLVPANDWIGLSAYQGTGSAVIQISAKTNNETDTYRSGKVYLYQKDELIDSLVVTQNGLEKSFRLEAEKYSNMSGLQTESTTDTGGGLNLSYADIGDWVTYQLEISFDGVYNVTFRHAGYSGDMDVTVDDQFVQNVTFPATPDWQIWYSHSAQLSLKKGLHELKLTFKKAGTNLNWIQFNWLRDLSANDIISNNPVSVYPLPADQFLNVDIGLHRQQVLFQIVSPEGKVVLSETGGDQDVKTMDVSCLNPGWYVLKVRFKTFEYAREILIR